MIYYAQIGKNGPIKIGHTNNARTRFSSIAAAAAALAVANYLRRPGPAGPVILTRAGPAILTRDNARQILRPGLYIARDDHGIEFTARDEEALLDVFMGHYPRGPEAIGAWRDALDEMIAKKLAGRQP